MGEHSRLNTMATVRAAVYERYGPPDVLQLRDVEQPAPKDDEVLVRVLCSTVNRSDTAFRAGEPPLSRLVTGLPTPRHRIPGSEFSGVVEATGAAVRQFHAGDAVFGIKPWTFGTQAEFICIKEGATIAPKPAGLSFEEAAAVCDGGLLALMNLRKVRLTRGQRVLVYGASGSIGTAALQLSHAVRAHATAVCAPNGIELVRSLGADDAIDYTRADFTDNGERYDVIFDAVGKESFARCKESLNAGGAYIPTDGFANIARGITHVGSGGRSVVVVLPPRYAKHDVLLLKRLIDAGRYRPVIDRVYAMDEVIEATRYVESQQKLGNVVLRIADDGHLISGPATQGHTARG